MSYVFWISTILLAIGCALIVEGIRREKNCEEGMAPIFSGGALIALTLIFGFGVAGNVATVKITERDIEIFAVSQSATATFFEVEGEQHRAVDAGIFKMVKAGNYHIKLSESFNSYGNILDKHLVVYSN